MTILQPPRAVVWALGALGTAIFGMHADARLLDAAVPHGCWATDLAGLASVLMTMYAGARLFGRRAGLYAALVLASTLYWMIGTADGAAAGWCAALPIPLVSLLIALRDDAGALERRLWMAACWAGMAVTMASRGAAGIAPPAAVVLVYIAAARDPSLWRRLHIGLGAPVFLAVLSGWCLLAGVDDALRWQGALIHDALERARAGTDAPARKLFVLFGLLPWLGVLPRAAASALGRGPGQFRPRLFVLIWIGAAALSFAYQGVPGDVVALVPAVALLAGCELGEGRRRGRALSALIMAGAGLTLMAIPPLLVLSCSPGALDRVKTAASYMLAAGFVAFTGAAVARFYVLQLKRDLAVVTLAVTGFATVGIIAAGAGMYGGEPAELVALGRALAR